MSKFRTMLGALTHEVGEQAQKVGELPQKIGEHAQNFKPFKALEKEHKLGKALHAEALAALQQFKKKHPEIKERLEKAHAYAVVPSIGRASLVLGGAYGVGEVFVHERVVGYGAIVQMTLGVQLGGTTFHELVIFNEESAFKQFKAGKFAFAADAAVELVKAGAQGSKGFGAASQIYVFDEGGMLLDLAIGLQKFIFRPAALGRMRTAKGAMEEGEASDEKERESGNEEEEEERAPAAKKEQPAHHHA